MKVTRIHLKEYLNFQSGLVIDLTYPIGHSKAGKPLDKVCFLGQSGTGKTNLLNLIKYISYEEKVNPFCIDTDKWAQDNVGVEFVIEETNLIFSKWANGPDQQTTIPTVIYRGQSIGTGDDCKYIVDRSFFKDKKVKLINFPFDLIRTSTLAGSAFSVQSQGRTSASDRPPSLDVSDNPDELRKSLTQKRQEYLERKVWDFSIDDISWLWNIVRDQIEEYEREYRVKMKEHVDLAEKDVDNSSKYIREFSDWKNSVSNPLKKIAEKFLDPFLNKFNLRVKTDIDFTASAHREFIRIEQMNNSLEVPFSFLSTGSRQIVCSSLPLSVLDIDDAIILFDEPERSLYPDVQVGLIKAYTKWAPNSQFFFATHSPIVASGFEPWEIVELIFDRESKKIRLDPYYKGERKVSNYHTFPQYLKYGDIYMDVFDLTEEGNPDHRKAEEAKLLELKSEFERLKRGAAKSDLLQSKFEVIKTIARKLRIDLKQLFVEQ